jgi:hypothetical protein
MKCPLFDTWAISTIMTMKTSWARTFHPRLMTFTAQQTLCAEASNAWTLVVKIAKGARIAA